MKISEELDKILSYAREEAMRTGSYFISPDHLFLGILRHSPDTASRILEGLSADLDSTKNDIDELIFSEDCVPFDNSGQVEFDSDSMSILNMTFFEAFTLGSRDIGSLHLLLALSKYQDDNYYKFFLDRLDIDSGAILAYCKDHRLLEEAAPKKEKKEEEKFRILGSISVRNPEIYS